MTDHVQIQVDLMAAGRLEIEVRSKRLKVTPYIFRSWTGRRWKDGEPYDGPVYMLGSSEEHRGNGPAI